MVKKTKEKKPTDKLADKTALTKFLQGVFGDAQKKILKKLWKRARLIDEMEPKYEKMSDEELKAQTEKFKKQIDKALKQSRETENTEKKAKKNKELSDTKILDEICRRSLRWQEKRRNVCLRCGRMMCS